MIIRQSEKAILLRDILMERFTRKYSDVSARVEGNRILFNFGSEEASILGQTDMREYLETYDIPGRVIEYRRTVILILRDE